MRYASRGLAAHLFMASILIAPTIGNAHDTWANGMAVPEWVKASCCGPEDAHRLDMDDVTEASNGWRIAGLQGVVPQSHVYPSQDGYAWAFWKPSDDRADHVYCLFLPLSG